MRNSIICFLILLCLSPLSGQDVKQHDTDDLIKMDLEELLNLELKIAVAGKKSLSMRDSPSIVTLITEEEIRHLGARDLIDILQFVPGFDFGMDVCGITGLGIRGNWAHEGKVLLLIDGQEMNGLLYANIPFGKHFPIDNIKRIEIIRGPGSAIYGGFAELGVINIITKQAKDLNGFQFNGTYVQMEKTYGYRNVQVSYGKVLNGMRFSSSLFYGQGIRSDRDYTDIYEGTYSMKENSTLNPLFFNFGFAYKNLQIRFIADSYKTEHRDAYDEILYVEDYKDPIKMDFISYYFEIKYDYSLFKRLILTPQFNYKRQMPWRSKDDYAIELNNTEIEEIDEETGETNTTSPYPISFNETVVRLTGRLTVNYELSEYNNIVAGVEAYQDHAEDHLEEKKFKYFYQEGGKNSIKYNNIASFAQGIFKTRIVNVTIGARYDDHDEFGSSFVPRMGVTKIIDDLHFKGLYSKAFRTPSIHNITYFNDSEGNEDKIKPEDTTVVEIETGYRFSKTMFATANFFNIYINDPIIYYYDEDDAYANYDGIGTRGFEVEYKYKNTWGSVNIGYSFYKVYENKVDQYAVRDTEDKVIDDDVLVGFPAHKITLYGTLFVTENMSINPSFIYFGEKYGYHGVTDEEALIVKKFKEIYFINLYFLYENLIVKNLNMGAGVYNILNQEYKYIQPYYDGFHAPLPGASREIFVKVSYKI